MNSYIIKFKSESKEELTNKILNDGGEIVYFSPILPILGAMLTFELKMEIEEYFDVVYVVETPEDGFVQGKIGNISSNQVNPVTLIPPLNSQGLRQLGLTGWGTTIAVLDSGVSENWISEHIDFTGFGVTTLIDHGTKVANIIKQFAPGSRILSFKVCHDRNVNYYNAMNAIHAAVKKADILNMSIGFDIETCRSGIQCELCETVNYYSVNDDKLFVVAAGNVGEENSIQCPANSQECITVGSVTYNSPELAEYSSLGRPGVKNPNIITTGTIYYGHGAAGDFDQGTSYSAPIVTGVMAALHHGLNKNINQAKSYLYTTVKDLGLPEHHQGFGLLDLDNLLEVLKSDQTNSEVEEQEQN